jgi:hypothetical protein
MAEETTQAIAKVDAKQLEMIYSAILGDATLPVESDPEAISRAIVERIMTADTFEDAFRPQQLEAWREYLEVPVLVRGLHFNPTTFEGQGSSIYAVVDIERLDNGETLTVSCGGRNVLTQLVKMVQNGWTDRPVKMIDKPTQEGYKALWLVAA